MFLIFFCFFFIKCEFNLFNIYPKYIAKSKTITISHKTKYSSNKILCIFGVLKNSYGKKIEEEMLKWLIPYYNIYIVYQKYPGKLFEYPALKFAQYLIKKKKKTLLLYVHSKGAFNPYRDNIQNIVRELWKFEFSGNNIKKYITPIINNQTDVATLFTNENKTTYFNGFYISYRAFDIIGNLDKKLNKPRFVFENLFHKTKARVLGILENNVQVSHPVARKYYEKIKSKNKIDDL